MREQKGYITIEATIVLSIYIFAFMMIFSLIHICRAQMKISVAINNAAKEISEYSYLYGVSGLSDSMYNAGQSAAQTQQDYSELPEDVGTLYSEISSLGDKQGNKMCIRDSSIQKRWQHQGNHTKYTTDYCR